MLSVVAPFQVGNEHSHQLQTIRMKFKNLTSPIFKISYLHLPNGHSKALFEVTILIFINKQIWTHQLNCFIHTISVFLIETFELSQYLMTRIKISFPVIFLASYNAKLMDLSAKLDLPHSKC
jgi:hypothetical protein